MNAEPGSSSLDIALQRAATGWPRAVNAAFARRLAGAIAAETGLRGAATVLLADDETLRAMNARFRGKDRPTNVLSFPAAGSAGPAYLGDIALALQTVAREAAEQEKTVTDHIAHLIVHGVLHLAGHDHGEERQAEAMEALERRILAALGIADPYDGELAAAS